MINYMYRIGSVHMATIGWDSDLMRDASDKALEKADNMESILNNLRSKLDSQLSGWTGDAANSMKESNNIAFDSILALIDYERAIATYNTKAADTFDEAEEMLSKLEI